MPINTLPDITRFKASSPLDVRMNNEDLLDNSVSQTLSSELSKPLLINKPSAESPFSLSPTRNQEINNKYGSVESP